MSLNAQKPMLQVSIELIKDKLEDLFSHKNVDLSKLVR